MNNKKLFQLLTDARRAQNYIELVRIYRQNSLESLRRSYEACKSLNTQSSSYPEHCSVLFAEWARQIRCYPKRNSYIFLRGKIMYEVEALIRSDPTAMADISHTWIMASGLRGWKEIIESGFSLFEQDVENLSMLEIIPLLYTLECAVLAYSAIRYFAPDNQHFRRAQSSVISRMLRPFIPYARYIGRLFVPDSTVALLASDPVVISYPSSSVSSQDGSLMQGLSDSLSFWGELLLEGRAQRPKIQIPNAC